MLYTLKGIILAGYAVQLAQASECTDKWSTVRCARQEKKGNCVPEAECPNPKKGGVKCKRANANCQATCGQCSSDDCAILVANLTSELEICTASPLPSMPPPSMPPSTPIESGPCPPWALTTVADGEQWCAGYCLGRAVHVVSVGQSFSSLATGVCVVADATAGDLVSIILTDGDDCLVKVGANEMSDVKTEAGNDLLCGGAGKDNRFYGGDGDDRLYGGDGDDSYFFGGNGNDTLHGGDGADNFFKGENGDDWLYGGDGDDTYFYGGDGDDFFWGGDGNEKYFYGGDGDDTLHGGPGADHTFDGNAGDDSTYT